ncbi:MAG: hypothetical protein ACP5K7_12900 [Verrucomicrobiia bacterium]
MKVLTRQQRKIILLIAFLLLVGSIVKGCVAAATATSASIVAQCHR